MNHPDLSSHHLTAGNDFIDIGRKSDCPVGISTTGCCASTPQNNVVVCGIGVEIDRDTCNIRAFRTGLQLAVSPIQRLAIGAHKRHRRCTARNGERIQPCIAAIVATQSTPNGGAWICPKADQTLGKKLWKIWSTRINSPINRDVIVIQVACVTTRWQGGILVPLGFINRGAHVRYHDPRARIPEARRGRGSAGIHLLRCQVHRGSQGAWGDRTVRHPPGRRHRTVAQAIAIGFAIHPRTFGVVGQGKPHRGAQAEACGSEGGHLARGIIALVRAHTGHPAVGPHQGRENHLLRRPAILRLAEPRPGQQGGKIQRGLILKAG